MSSTKQRIIILGAASGIAEATARLYAAEGASLVLAGRNRTRLEQIAADLRVRGAVTTEIEEIDLATADAGALDRMVASLGGVDVVLIAYGTMPANELSEHDLTIAKSLFETNFTSPALWSLAAANVLERQGRGTLVVLGSPAGDRGRRKNYVYGATKGGLETLVEGISHRFADKGPRAVLVKPGPTDTAMTAGLPKGGALWATAETVAKAVKGAADGGGPVRYAPMRWWLIMKVVRSVPSAIFNKVNF